MPTYDSESCLPQEGAKVSEKMRGLRKFWNTRDAPSPPSIPTQQRFRILSVSGHRHTASTPLEESGHPLSHPVCMNLPGAGPRALAD